MEFEQSGLTRRAFCAQHGLSAATLDNYRKRRRGLKSGQVRPPTVASRILPVEFVSGARPFPECGIEDHGVLRVELANGRRIEVAHGFDAATLERLIAILDTPGFAKA
jgi:hypothetical protein